MRYLADDRRILRQEPRLDSKFYEISHDTIARSIFESRKWRVPRKWRLAGAVSILFMLALGAFAFWAVLEKGKVETEKGKAENTVAFLIGEDFLDAVRPLGKLDVLEKIQRAVPCKDAEIGVKYDSVGLRNLGLACMNEGDIDYLRFRLRAAGSKYEMAHKHFVELARRQGKPDDPDLADSLAKLAQVASDQLELDKAERLTRQSLEIQEHVASSEASDHEVARDLAENYFRLGGLKRKQRNLQEALANFEKGIALSKPFSDRAQSSVEWLYLMQDGLLGRAAVLVLLRNQQEADADFKQAYDCANRAVSMSPFAPEAKYRQAVARSELPISAGQKAADVMRQDEEVLEDMIKLAQWDPENKLWERDLAATHVLLAEALVKNQRREEAVKHYGTAIGKMEELGKIDPTNRQLQSEMLVWLLERLGSSSSQ